MKIEIKNLKVNQVIYDEDPTDHYRVFSEPKFKDGKWQVEVTTSGDYVWFFKDGDKLWDNKERTDN
mgnify:FL=1